MRQPLTLTILVTAILGPSAVSSRAELRPFIPAVEALPENMSIDWGRVIDGVGEHEIWGMWDGAGGLTVARADGVPVRFERVEVVGAVGASAGERIHVRGTIEALEGRYRLILKELVERKPAIPVTDLLPLPSISGAVAEVDLGPHSPLNYADETSTVMKSAGWEETIEASLNDAEPRAYGTTSDGRFLVVELRGPRLPPEQGIVFRYLRICAVVDPEQKRLRRILADVEGWVEE